MSEHEIHRPDCPGESGCTLALCSRFSSSTVARMRGWDVGTVLEGDEGYGPTRITLLYLGEGVLARSERSDGTPGYEGMWTLSCRCWGEVAK